MKRLWATSVAAALVAVSCLTLLGAAPALADNVWSVDCTPSDLVTAVNQAVAAGSGTINLAAGCTYTFTAPDSGKTALPLITGLSGPLTINGNGATLQRSTASGTPDFRLVHIGTGHLDVTIDDLTISGGSVGGTDAGGGLDDEATGVTLADDTISHNSADQCGGGVYAPNGLVVRDSTISDNAQVNTNTSVLCSHVLGGGGGLFLGGNTQITASTITGNTAEFGGGGIEGGGPGPHEGNPSERSALALTNDTIVGNQSVPRGGRTDGGGGIWSNIDLVLVNDTLANNTNGALISGGADANDVAQFWVQGSIVDGNCSMFPGQKPFSMGSNVLVGCPTQAIAGGPLDIWCPSAGCAPDATTATSPGFSPLQDNGGPTWTQALGPSSPAYHLEPAGDCPATDQRGATRPQPAGATACNAGAYETQAIETALAYTGPTSGLYGSAITLSARLTAPRGAAGIGRAGTGIAGQAVSIGFGAAQCTALTDASGTATCQVIVGDSAAAGPYPIALRYSGATAHLGEDYYQPSSDAQQSFTVNAASAAPPAVGRVPTSLAAKRVLAAQVSAVLTDAHTGAPVAGQVLRFTAGRRTLCKARTNSAGRAACSSLNGVLAAVLNLRYAVSYTGSGRYLGVIAHGSAVRLAAQLLGVSHATDSELERALHRIGVTHLKGRLRALRRHSRIFAPVTGRSAR